MQDNRATNNITLAEFMQKQIDTFIPTYVGINVGINSTNKVALP
jgi:hypothetical protein